MCFRYFILLICTLHVNISAIKAQVNYEVDDTINGEAVDMPVGVFVTEEDLNVQLTKYIVERRQKILTFEELFRQHVDASLLTFDDAKSKLLSS